MYVINWELIAELVNAIGQFLLGLAAILTLFIQYGYRLKFKKRQSALKMMLIHYRKYMASEKGIVWSDYPENSENIIKRISNETGIDQKLVKELLDSLKKENKI